MAAPAPPRIDNIEIPDRPAIASASESAQLTRKRVLLYGGIAAAALLILIAIALLRPGSEEVARLPADAPLIKAEEQPIKVSPKTPGGMEVPNRDILVYERLQGTAAGKGPVEHLLPESEQPITPPAPPRPAETASPPNAIQTDLWASDVPGGTSLLVPPVPEPPARPSAESDKAPQSQNIPKAKLSPSPTGPDPAAAQAKMRSQTATPTQTKVANAPATESSSAQADRPASGNGFQLQLFSSRSVDDAKGAWARLRDKNADLLGSLSPSVARVNLDNRGTFYRLRAGPIASATKARSICDSLAARRVSCLVVRSSG
jgi:SPOR domain